MQPQPSLGTLLGGLPVGIWVVIDPGMTKLLGSAETPEEALRKAGVNLVAVEEVAGPRPIMMQVPDPNMICLY